MALRARPKNIVGMVMARGAVLVTSGLVVGIAGALATARLIRAQLFGVQTGGVQSWAAVLTVLAGAAVIAVWLPARRAAAIGPATGSGRNEAHSTGCFRPQSAPSVKRSMW